MQCNLILICIFFTYYIVVVFLQNLGLKWSSSKKMTQFLLNSRSCCNFMGAKQNWGANRNPINRTPSQAANLSLQMWSSVLNKVRQAVFSPFSLLFTFYKVADTVFCLFFSWKSSMFCEHIFSYIILSNRYKNMKESAGTSHCSHSKVVCIELKRIVK